MSLILTLVASQSYCPLETRHLAETLRLLTMYHIQPTCAPVWLDHAQAADIGISHPPHAQAIEHLRDFLDRCYIDVFVVPVEGRRKKLLLADMDSTIIQGETIDHLAEHAGVKDQIAAITKSAMEGQIDFASALRERVALLKGLPVGALQKTSDSMMITPGAWQLVRTMQKNGAESILVSGGFTFFTQAVADRVGFNHHHGNVLKISHNRLEGLVENPILDQSSKLDLLHFHAQRLKIKPQDVLAIGDGANDIPMLKAAGLGIGFRPKEVVAKEIGNVIIHGNLSAALFAQGFTAGHLNPEQKS
jgi:phosphoserine phosphatase